MAKDKAEVNTEEAPVVETPAVVIPHSPDASGAGAADVVAAAAGAPAAPPVEPEVAPEPTPLSPLGELLVQWAYGNLGGGPIARNTECWNALLASLPTLEAAINNAE